jgi:hypothetical protein
MEWQDISTAPKDGTHILLYGTYQWEHYDDNQKRGIVVGWYYSSENEWVLENANPYADYIQPTHWMQLPVKPI